MKLANLLLWVSVFVTFSQCAPASSSSAPTKPLDDPFYTPPDGFELAKEGEVLKIRPTPHQLRSIFLPINVKKSWQILVRSSDTHGNATAILSTIIEPYNSDPTKLVSYQIAEDASFTNCAPSYSIQYGALMDTLIAQVEMFFMQMALNEGWWIVVPDYEGVKLSFTAGRVAAHSVLDSIRGTLSTANATGLHDDPQIVMWGYSGGSLATGWAASLQPTYAPDLNGRISGAALGGFVTNITETILSVDNTLYAGLIANGINGLGNEYPEMKAQITPHINPTYLPQYNKDGVLCMLISIIDSVYATIFHGATKPYLWFPDGYNVFDLPVVKKTLSDVTLGLDREEMPKIPLFVYHGLDDSIVPSINTFRIYDIWKTNGIKSMEVAISNSTRHITEFFLGSPAAFTFLKKAFNGDVINGTLLTYRYTNLDYPGVDPDIISFLYGSIKTVLGIKLGPVFEKRSGSFTDSPILNERGFDDYDEIVENYLRGLAV